MTIEQIREALRDRNLAFVGRELMITRSYLQAIRAGKTTPSQETQNRIAAYLERSPCS